MERQVSPDIEVELQLLRTEEGGLKYPIDPNLLRSKKTLYKSQFYYDGFDWDAGWDFQRSQLVSPGDLAVALVTFLSPECHEGKLNPGKEFLMRVGQRVVGRGKVLHILALAENAGRNRALFGECPERVHRDISTMSFELVDESDED